MPVAPAVIERAAARPASAMKMSMFASFIPYRGKILGFNALSDSFVLMEGHLWEDLDAARRSGTFAGLAGASPAMVQGARRQRVSRRRR
jgi:hypothetical protein